MLRLSSNVRAVLPARFASAWVNEVSKSASNDNFDVEKVFVNGEVQKLIYSVTGLNMEDKVFRPRNIGQQQRSQYHLMTDKMFENSLKQFEKRGRRFLQFVPFKEPRRREFKVLAKDPEISGFDQSKFVFTDITFDATNRDRLVVIRETDGTLRTALPGEHDRMNRVYYEQPDRPVVPPAVFKDPHLSDALKREKHEFVMDWACYFYEPDDPEFVDLSKKVFDDILSSKKLQLLHSTRHFGSFTFYGVLNNNISLFLEFFGAENDVKSAADMVRLEQLMFPDWRTVISPTEDDRHILREYLKRKKQMGRKVPSLVKLLEGHSNN